MHEPVGWPANAGRPGGSDGWQQAFISCWAGRSAGLGNLEGTRQGAGVCSWRWGLAPVKAPVKAQRLLRSRVRAWHALMACGAPSAQDQERPTFGHLPGNSGHLPGNSGRADEGAEAEDDGWETVLGGPKKRGVARSTKRARMAPVRRKD